LQDFLVKLVFCLNPPFKHLFVLSGKFGGMVAVFGSQLFQIFHQNILHAVFNRVRQDLLVQLVFCLNPLFKHLLLARSGEDERALETAGLALAHRATNHQSKIEWPPI